jgi:mannose-6-phosphate isomerase-like protein (cupin superfamily)
MSDYSKINLLNIDDSAKDNANIEARFARKHLDSRDLGITLLRYKPNFRSPMAHSHKVQEEAYVVIKGSGKMLLNGEVTHLKVWDVVRVAPETTRAIEAGPEGIEVIAIGGPKPAESDGVRQEPNWPSE